MSKEKLALSAEILKEFLHYDPLTGIFNWVKVNNCGGVKVGDIVGCLNSDGYIVIRINGVQHRAHRLAWLYMKGVMPVELIDHKNGVRSDNRFCNLREATRQQNNQNRTTALARNKSGFLGVSFFAKLQKFKAAISVNNKDTNLGYFDTPEEAHQAYLAAKRKLHPFGTI